MTTPPSDFGPRTQELLPRLTVEEKAAITAGSGTFHLTGVERLGIPNWLTTDGPNGARGTSLLGSGDAKATCIPSASALGATWNPELLEDLGRLLGREARTKACRVLLAPTVNLHRAPLAGRNFECYSEDPLLTGKLAAAFVRGVQAEGVITTVKHFVGNETETDRWTSNSIIDDRALRELYLLPFELTVTEGGALGIMTSYNRVNGEWCTEQRWLLTEVLRGEWGFEGFVTTDWAAAADTVRSAEAGLNVEMPVGDRAFGSVLGRAVAAGRVSEATLDDLAGRLLSSFERIGAWDDEPVEERSIDDPAHRGLARRAAVDAMVLYRNHPAPLDGGPDPTATVGPVLPLDVGGFGSIAVIGPNAARAQIMGGGSANLRPFHRTSPLDAIRSRLGDAVTVVHAEGCNIDKQPPLLAGAGLVAPDGQQGFGVEVFDNVTWSGDPIGTANRDTGRLLFGAEPVDGVHLNSFSFRATTTWTPPADGDYRIELTQVSPARVLLDGELLIDGITDPPPPGTPFFGFGATLPAATRTLEGGVGHEIVVELIDRKANPLGGVDLRVAHPFPADAFERAVAAAAEADVAVVVVGTNDDWETEGEDRTTLALPGDQDALVSAVAAANPRTVVVLNTGSPVTMPWLDEVPAVVQSWLGGQEMGDALVDVLTGEADPGGRLPTTFPVRIEHTPSYGSFPGDNGQVPYAESVFMGYRWYQSRHLPVLFPFGHGLSYTTFEIGEPTLSAASIPIADLEAGASVTVTVPVTNTGGRAGTHVVQCYVRPHQSAVVRPDAELKAFAKVALAAGEATTVDLTLDTRSFAYWDPAQPEWPAVRDSQPDTLPQLRRQERRTDPGWTVDAGRYDVVVAHSVLDVAGVATVDLT